LSQRAAALLLPLLLPLHLACACAGAPKPSPNRGADTGPTVDPSPDTGPITPPDPGDGTVSDPLSMPLHPTLTLDEARSAATCASCHPDQVRDWEGTAHAWAMRDPVFQAATMLRQAEFDGAQDRFCLQCHSNLGSRGGALGPGFSFEGLPEVVAEGVTCVSCHQIDAVLRVENAGHSLDLAGPMRGPFADAAATPAHASAESALLTGAELCGSCHDVREINGLPLERPYAEWTSAPAAAEARPCQTCHMPAATGPAAVGGPARPLRQHRFLGVSLPLDEDGVDEAIFNEKLAEVEALLTGVATLRLSARPGSPTDLLVTLRNELDGHAFPTGSTFNRQVWLELSVTDATGALLYQTGDLDENGDLRDAWSAIDPYGDADLIQLGSRLTAPGGAPTFLAWHATEHTNPALQPLQIRSYTLFVPTTADTAYPLRVEARLRMRAYGPYLMRALGLDALIDQLVIVDIDAARLEISAP
jgi:hypothetical protein